MTNPSILTRDFAPATRTEQVKNPQLLARSAELRDGVTRTWSDATELHGDVQQMELEILTRQFEQVQVTPLLEQLSEQHAFAWALLARVAGVSPTAVRKWRRGEATSPVFHQRLAELAAFSALLQRVQPTIHDVSYWLEMPVIGRSDVSRLEVYLEGHRTRLLDLATGRSTGEDLLDAVKPEWREQKNASDSIIWHEDGTPSIVVAED